MPGPPPPITRRFRDLGTVVDELHALFAAWGRDGRFAGVLDADGLCVVQLAVHEWIANLVQHADFGRRAPEIALTVAPEAGGVRCVIEDNSDGFDFHGQLGAQEARVAGPEPSERGRGLLMMLACTEDLCYEPTGDGRQRLAFLVRPEGAPESRLPLFPATDALGAPFGDVEGDGVGVPYPVEPTP